MGVCLQIRERGSLEMPNQEETAVNRAGGVFLLSLSYTEDGRRVGQLRHLYDEEFCCFSDLTEAVLKMEEILDKYMPPRSPSRIRSFVETKKESVPYMFSGNDMEYREKERFYIQVHYRQNSSWQGEIRWQNGKQNMCFRSVLELLKLLDSICGRSKI